MAKFPVFQKGGQIPLKFDQPLKLEDIPTKNQIRVIDNYSPRYDYIVEGDKIYYAKKRKNFWVDISDNDVARKNLYNFLGNKYNFRGYEDNEDKIWEDIKAGKFNYKSYRENQNKPATPPQRQKQVQQKQEPAQDPNRLVYTRVPTAGGGFTNIQVPAYMVDNSKNPFGVMGNLKQEYYGQAMDIAKKTQPERYADPINNAANWLPFIILTGGRGLGNMGYNFISPLVNRMAQGTSNIGKTLVSNTGRALSNIGNKVMPIFSSAKNYVSRIPQTISNTLYSTPTRRAVTNSVVAGTTFKSTFDTLSPFLKLDNPSSDTGYLWNTFLDEGVGSVYDTVINGIRRRAALNDPDYADAITSFNVQQPTDTTSMYGIRPLSIVGDTIPVSKSSNRFQISLPDGKQYIVPESILPGDYQFSFRNRGDFTPLNTEGAIITSMQRFFPYEKRQLVSDRGVRFKNYIGIDRNGNLKAGPAEIFGPGDIMAGTYANEIVSMDVDENGNVVGSRQKENRDKYYPNFTFVDENTGQDKHTTNSTALNFLMNPNNPNAANMYGSVYGGRVLIKAGDELRLVSGSINDINREFEAMKKRNGVRSATFYTLDNGTYAKGIRTYDQRITSNDLREYDRVNSTGGSFLYIKNRVPQRNVFRSDTILTPNIRTVDSGSYKKGHPLNNEQRGVVLHHTGDYPSLDAIVQDLTTPIGQVVPFRQRKQDREASAHVVIGTDGTRKVLATPDKVTFHAGSSAHDGRTNVNDFMIGIEFQGDTNKRDLTPQQIESAIEYLEPIIRRNNIRLEDIVTHQNVRDLYNDYARKAGLKEAESKPDINQRNYNLILQALLRKIYYKK